MNKKLSKIILKNYSYLLIGTLVVSALVILWLNTWVGIAAIIAAAAVYFVYTKQQAKLRDDIEEYAEDLLADYSDECARVSRSDPNPACIVSEFGKIYWENVSFTRMFPDDDASEQLSKELLHKVFESGQIRSTFDWNGRKYEVRPVDMPEEDIAKKILFFRDITGNDIFKKLFRDNRACAAFIYVDNYEELISQTPPEDQSALTADIDSHLRSWASGIEGAIIKYRAGRYVVFFKYEFLRILREGKFAIIDEMHEIETEADFPTSISIGIGFNTPTIEELLDYASDAIELAQGRGGDQVVIKRMGKDPEFFGGALTTVEKRNKGKSRIISHSLYQLIKGSDRVFIMGHKHPDMDAFGAAVGIYTLARGSGRPVEIVLDDPGEGIELIYNAALEDGSFNFTSSQKAISNITHNSLLVMVDCHIPVITECPELTKLTDKIVVIDHHRRSKDTVENPVLTHTEVYASSASELVTELLQYAGEKVEPTKFEAEALLAGITVDTKNFTVNTGVRTFEAASWLRSRGADNTEVQTFFKLPLEFYKKKVNIISSAEIIGNEIAVAYTKNQDEDMQILVAQAADELLTMKGIQAAFAAGKGPSRTVISARSLGKVNVQVIMEKLGGGGHVNVAAAQVEEGPEEAIQRLVQVLREEELL